MSKPNVSVVICCYNGEDRIGKAIGSLKKQTYPKGKFEIIVVDDCSTDKTAKRAKRHAGVRLISHESNRGVAAARNTGWQHAKGKWIAYMDDDCVADPHWLEELERSMKKHDVVGAGGLVMPKAEKSLLQRYLFRAGYGRPASIGSGTSKGGLSRFITYLKDHFGLAHSAHTEGEVYEVYGANSIFARSALKAVRGFNEDLNSAEDSDICRRIREHKPDKTIWFNPDAKVKHDYTSSFKGYLVKLFKRQADTARYYRIQKKLPPIFPFPLLILASSGLLATTSVYAGLAALLLLPLAAYAWWLVDAVRTKDPERILYPYIQFAEESVRIAGLIKAMILPSRQTATASRKLSVSKQAVVLGLLGWWAATLVLQLPIFSSVLRTVVVGGFLLFAPGALLVYLLKARNADTKFWLYAVSTGVALFILELLAANTVSVVTEGGVGFTKASIATVTSLVFIALLGAFYRYTPNSSFAIPVISRGKIVRGTLALTLPVVAAIGALYLTATGDNTLSMVVLSACAVLMLFVGLRKKTTSAMATHVTLFVLSYAILLVGSMRGQYITGIDMAREFYLSDAVRQAGYWTPSLVRDAYNACLSVALLPLGISKLLGVSEVIAFKALIPAIYAFVPSIIYAISRMITSHKKALLAALFFIAQPAFVTWSSIPARQMAGFLFFAALILTLLDKSLSPVARRVLVVLLGTSVVVSHYSTTYLTLGLLGVVWAAQFALSLWAEKKLPWKLTSFRPIISAPLLVTLCAVAAVWYGPITHTSGNITGEMKSAWMAISDGKIDVSSDAHADRTSLLDQITFSSEQEDVQEVFSEYLQEVDERYDDLRITPIQSTKENLTAQAPERMPLHVPSYLANSTILADQLIRKIVRLFLLVGIGIYLVRAVRRRGKEGSEYELLALGAAFTLLLVIVVPHASIDYDVGRTSQQLLVILGLPTVIGGICFSNWLLRIIKRPPAGARIVGLTFALLLLFASGVPTQLTGGVEPKMSLNNYGNQYDQWFTHRSEALSASWLAENRNDASLIQNGYFGGNRLLLGGMNRSSYNDILPWTIDSYSYVYASYGETVNGLATTYYKGAYIRYDYPTNQIKQHKNVIYSNNETEIYK